MCKVINFPQVNKKVVQQALNLYIEYKLKEKERLDMIGEEDAAAYVYELHLIRDAVVEHMSMMNSWFSKYDIDEFYEVANDMDVFEIENNVEIYQVDA